VPDSRSRCVSGTKGIRVLLHFHRIVSTIPLTDKRERKECPDASKKDSETIVRDIKPKTRKMYNTEEKIRIVLEGLRGEGSIAAIYRRERISTNLLLPYSF